MVNCPYLIYEPSSCVACTGWVCQAFGRKKRLSDTSVCVDEEQWVECPRYLQKVTPVKEPESEEEVIELPPTEEVTSTQTIGETITVTAEPESVEVQAPLPAPSTDCPYLGPVPAGKEACCGFWCYAYDSPIRTTTACNSPPTWRECKGFMKAASRGVK